MRISLIIFILYLNINHGFSKVWIVDQNGAGNFTSIQAAITAANTNDTVRVWPGVYMEQVFLNKNILLEGSGYENTVITGSFNGTVAISAGKIRWFKISSLKGNGVIISNGIIANCVIKSSTTVGIYGYANCSGLAINCVILESGLYGGVYADGATTTVINCISINNSGYGYNGANNPININLSYSNGSRYNNTNKIGCIDTNPLFVDALNEDYHLQAGSPCIDTGQPSLYDPDGTRSDMGYFGGPDCPIFPVVYNLNPIPAGNNINIKAKARANY